jgi:hypothetical protein
VILTVLHVLQWGFTLFCVPLFFFLIYALFKDWRKHMLEDNGEAEYKRGYDDGLRDGFEAGLLARVVEPVTTTEETDD